MVAEVCNSQQCPQCQWLSPYKLILALLIPLPIIRIPFERVGIDLVGPLPKSACGHEYILVLVNYATRYPEAIPLYMATSKNIARELLLLFSQVRILKDLLTNQGTPFMFIVNCCRSNNHGPPATTPSLMDLSKVSSTPSRGCSGRWWMRKAMTGTYSCPL